METQFPIKQILNGAGEIVDSSFRKAYSKKWVQEVYEKLLVARLFDRKCVNLQRQGRIGTYVPFEGQEAAQIGSALALEEEDWLFPTYRDHGASLTFGQSMLNILMYWNGRYEGCVPPKGKHIFPPAVPIASQLLHATGAAWAEKMKARDRVALVYLGDGATSEGDFHEAMNFASVYQVPVIFFNQNNGYAISVPFERQTHAKTIAQKGLAYDIEGIRVDGNDVFAVYEVTRYAVEKARKGGGPTLIEALTWRYGAHTTSDDPSKYRDQSQNEWRRNEEDPIKRIECFMKANNLWEDDLITLEESLLSEIVLSVKQLEDLPNVTIDQMFDYVYSTPPWPLIEQKNRQLIGGGDSE
jgi:2-oxoisovalerate dehydrogenase E1 component alpha subunit